MPVAKLKRPMFTTPVNNLNLNYVVLLAGW